MREIKFRAWDAEYKRMFIPEAISNDGKVVILFSKNEGRKYDIPVMQFTGLKDKNGEDIWEGDIIGRMSRNKKTPNVLVRMGAVVYQRGEFVLLRPKESTSLLTLTEIGWRNYEVIGNIHENPELLN